MSISLLSYQIEHTNILTNAIIKHSRALDTSDTGTGKTFCAIELCKRLNKKPFIICPKAVMNNWINVAKQFNISIFGIVNYESLLSGIYYQSTNLKTKKVIPFLKINYIHIYNTNEKSKEYNWDINLIPEDIIFIYDEAHRCKNHKSLNGKLFLQLTKLNVKILLISATIIDKDIYTELLVNTFRLNVSEYSPKKSFQTRIQIMDKLHKVLFPEYGHRMTIKMIRSQSDIYFKENKILIEPIEMENKNEIKKQYDIIKIALQNLKRKRERSSGIGLIIRALQSIEMLKLPNFIKLTDEYLQQNSSIAIFFNYTSTLLQYCSHYNINCIIYGDQTTEERNKNISDFTNDKQRIIVCNIKAGGVGLSLHDTKGQYPRKSLISPTWSAQDLLQVLGRIYRANSKTNCEQRILFCSDTYEEMVSNAIQSKIENISLLNDGDIKSYFFTEDMENIDFTEEALENIESNIIEEETNPDILNNDIIENEELETLLIRKKMLENELKEIKKRIKQLQ